MIEWNANRTFYYSRFLKNVFEFLSEWFCEYIYNSWTVMAILIISILYIIYIYSVFINIFQILYEHLIQKIIYVLQLEIYVVYINYPNYLKFLIYDKIRITSPDTWAFYTQHNTYYYRDSIVILFFFRLGHLPYVAASGMSNNKLSLTCCRQYDARTCAHRGGSTFDTRVYEFTLEGADTPIKYRNGSRPSTQSQKNIIIILSQLELLSLFNDAVLVESVCLLFTHAVITRTQLCRIKDFWAQDQIFLSS